MIVFFANLTRSLLGVCSEVFLDRGRSSFHRQIDLLFFCNGVGPYHRASSRKTRMCSKKNMFSTQPGMCFMLCFWKCFWMGLHESTAPKNPIVSESEFLYLLVAIIILYCMLGVNQQFWDKPIDQVGDMSPSYPPFLDKTLFRSILFPKTPRHDSSFIWM